MQFIGIDLGTTNIKAAAYDERFHLLGRESEPVHYLRRSLMVEFDAENYFSAVTALLRRLLNRPDVQRRQTAQLVFTGQAESLVVLDREDRPCRMAISWMDERSQEESRELGQRFAPAVYEGATGQQAVLPTWPATKILWLRRHEPEVFRQAASYMLLKDYIVFRLTGIRQADRSIATFSSYFDIYRKAYWPQMLEALELREDQLPPLVEPCTAAGRLSRQAAASLDLPESVLVNHGTLDHFAGMIGTGNTRPGGVSLSTGTVMALAAMTDKSSRGIAMHYGFLPDTYVMLPVAESGGVSLEWFRRTCMNGCSYDSLNEALAERSRPGPILFLPYLVGTNAPEFDRRASGVFFGLRAGHDSYDMAAGVMEGVACLLRKNCEFMRQKGASIHYIVATGGGAKSDIWCQMQADITGLPVLRPKEMEAACLGAAMAGAVNQGVYSSYEEAAAQAVAIDRRFEPDSAHAYDTFYRRFCGLYEASVKITDIT